MSAFDRREMPWKVLRCVVEVKVPPTCRATDKDLAYHIETAMDRNIGLPRSTHANAYFGKVRVKQWLRWWPVFRITEKRQGRL